MNNGVYSFFLTRVHDLKNNIRRIKKDVKEKT